MQSDSDSLRMFHVENFLVAFDVATDERLGFLADAELLVHGSEVSARL